MATTLRYLNYSKYKSLTARQVCDKMKIKYREGGTDYDEQRALKKYGVTYSRVDDCQVSFATIKRNILAQKPLLISAYGNSSGHTYTLVGYTSFAGLKQIICHDPYTNACTSVGYKSNTTTRLAFRNEILGWYTTVRCK